MVSYKKIKQFYHIYSSLPYHKQICLNSSDWNHPHRPFVKFCNKQRIGKSHKPYTLEEFECFLNYLSNFKDMNTQYTLKEISLDHLLMSSQDWELNYKLFIKLPKEFDSESM